MLPFVAGAVGMWFYSWLLNVALVLTIIWGALIMGYGFGNPEVSTRIEIVTMAVYVSIAGAALILAWIGYIKSAVALLAIGYVIVPIADYLAAREGNALAHFAPLRLSQMSIAGVSLLAILARLVTSAA